MTLNFPKIYQIIETIFEIIDSFRFPARGRSIDTKTFPESPNKYVIVIFFSFGTNFTFEIDDIFLFFLDFQYIRYIGIAFRKQT